MTVFLLSTLITGILHYISIRLHGTRWNCKQNSMPVIICLKLTISIRKWNHAIMPIYRFFSKSTKTDFIRTTYSFETKFPDSFLAETKFPDSFLADEFHINIGSYCSLGTASHLINFIGTILPIPEFRFTSGKQQLCIPENCEVCIRAQHTTTCRVILVFLITCSTPLQIYIVNTTFVAQCRKFCTLLTEYFMRIVITILKLILYSIRVILAIISISRSYCSLFSSPAGKP